MSKSTEKTNQKPTKERTPVFVASSLNKNLNPCSKEPPAPVYSDVPAHLLESHLKLKVGSSKPLPAVMSPLLPYSSVSLSHQLVTPALRLNLDLAREYTAGQSSPGSNSTASTPKTGLTPFNSELKVCNHSVSFCETDLQDRSRRFTISAHPLSINLSGPVRQNSLQQVPQRKPSNVENGPEPLHTNSALAFLVVHRPEAPFLSNFVANRTLSPSSSDLSAPQGGPTSSYSSSPAPSRQNSGLQVDPKSGSAAYNQHCNLLANQLNGLGVPGVPNCEPIASKRGSHQGSEGAATPISISRKSSLTKKSNKTLVLSPVGPPVPFQQFLTKEDDKKLHILLGCTGSVATIKIPMIIDKLFQLYGSNRISVQLITTKCACHFLKGLKIHKDVKIWRDEDVWTNLREWDANANTTTTPTTSDQSVKKQKSPYDKLLLHNELRRWADIMLIAPLSANTLAKIANGLSDNLLSSIVRTWGPVSGNGPNCPKKPILVAPAMNTYMYTNPLTNKHLKILSLVEEGFGMEILKPVEKVLVCGDIGMGGMREWLDIVDQLKRRLKALVAEKVALIGTSIDEDVEEDKENENDDQDYDDDDDEDEDEDEEDEDEDNDEDDYEAENNEPPPVKVGISDVLSMSLDQKSETEKKSLVENEKPPVTRPRSLINQPKAKRQNDGLLFDLSEDIPLGLTSMTGTRILLSSEVQSII